MMIGSVGADAGVGENQNGGERKAAIQHHAYTCIHIRVMMQSDVHFAVHLSNPVDSSWFFCMSGHFGHEYARRGQ